MGAEPISQACEGVDDLDALELGAPELDVRPGSLVVWRHADLGWQWYVFERDEEVHRMAVNGYPTPELALRAARAELVATPRALPAVLCHPDTGEFHPLLG